MAYQAEQIENLSFNEVIVTTRKRFWLNTNKYGIAKIDVNRYVNGVTEFTFFNANDEIIDNLPSGITKQINKEWNSF